MRDIFNLKETSSSLQQRIRVMDIGTITFLNGLYKIGLTHSWDLQLGYELYNVNYDPDGNKIDQELATFNGPSEA